MNDSAQRYRIVHGYCSNCGTSRSDFTKGLAVVHRENKLDMVRLPNCFTAEELRDLSPVYCGKCKQNSGLLSVEPVEVEK